MIVENQLELERQTFNKRFQKQMMNAEKMIAQRLFLSDARAAMEMAEFSLLGKTGIHQCWRAFQIS